MLKLKVDYLNSQDDSGYICSKELGSLLRTLGYNPTESEVFKLMAEVDVDHNGKVEYLVPLVASRTQTLTLTISEDYWIMAGIYPYS